MHSRLTDLPPKKPGSRTSSDGAVERSVSVEQRIAGTDDQWPQMPTWGGLSGTVVPRTLQSRLGDRSFGVAGPRLWNSLPAELRQQDICLTEFRRLLRRHFCSLRLGALWLHWFNGAGYKRSYFLLLMHINSGNYSALYCVMIVMIG